MTCRVSLLALLSGLLTVCALAQTTQGIISGRLVTSRTGRPLGGATVSCWNGDGLASGSSQSDANGYYVLPLLSPGLYRVRAETASYQAQELQDVELAVASRLEIEFRMRPLSDVWEAGQYNSVFLPGAKTVVTFYGPDVDSSKSGSFEAQKGRRAPLETSVSDVINSAEIATLPLGGRDVYTMLVTQAGVTSDAATGRGLGLSANGQRPSASNYLLDGVENNNYVITGPLAQLPPEVIQEYRVSTNNFSAEYGRTSGFLANAITRSGSSSFHGDGYFYFKNDVLDANDFQNNLKGIARPPQKEAQTGFVVGGSILRDRLFFLSSLDQFRSRGVQGTFSFIFPGQPLQDFLVPGGASDRLLKKYPAPFSNPNDFTGTLKLAPPVAVDRTLAIERFDYAPPGGKDRIFGRLIVSRQGQPDFIWTPYPDFVTPLHHNLWALAFSHTRSIRPNLINEARVSYSNDYLYWNRAHPEVPFLQVSDNNGRQLTLPGSPAAYSYSNRNGSFELLDNVLWSHGSHQMAFGGGLLRRGSSGALTIGRDGAYLFAFDPLQLPSLIKFALNQPDYVTAAIDRTSLAGPLREPDFNRQYRYWQGFFFAQDTWRVSSRLTVNYGLRYELFGGPSNIGKTKDALLQLGPGSNLAAQIASSPGLKTGTGDQQLFGTDKKDFAVRVGASYDLLGNARTLLRGAYGIFYDRPFDNLWENLRSNTLVLPPIIPLPATPTGSTDFLAPIGSVLATLNPGGVISNFPDVTVVDPNLKNGYAHSYFLGAQQRITDSLSLEVNGLGSLGRRLIVTDVVNRAFSIAPRFSGDAGRLNPNLPDIAYRSGLGSSDYNALAVVGRYRASRGQLQVSYTWSHSIDNQSDALIGDFFNLNFTSIQSTASSGGRSSFSRQFDPRADRGNSDFDQRHNLVVFSYWDLPSPFPRSPLARALFANWTVAELAAFRSGFPYTVGAPSSGAIANNRADIVDPARTVLANPIPVPGGVQLLDPAGFALPAPGSLGNSGRNAFIGPGFYNVDLSVARRFGLRRLGEGGRLNLRADFFNVLNHANLNNPNAVFGNAAFGTFGIATFGRQGKQSGFPSVSPLNETARQIQLSVKLEF
ncbi:MAG: carboxypeptidase regulatory-like domain-containing protein [Acidobacteriota bacterium]|nr:carboxypeptidase regulatory-like domain-containing protein [Acidobacteriota bacterium]